MDKNEIIKAIESHRKGECHNCPYEGLSGCIDIMCENAVKFIKETIKADTVKKTLDVVRSRGTRNAYSCIISGEIRETYIISGKALEEIEEELLNEVR